MSHTSQPEQPEPTRLQYVGTTPRVILIRDGLEVRLTPGMPVDVSPETARAFLEHYPMLFKEAK